jgi:hypothetical protein
MTEAVHEWIQSAVDRYVTEHETTHPYMAAAARIVGALPLLLDWSYGVAIQPGGELIGPEWAEPEAGRVETNPHLRFLALVTGARRYRELEGLFPVRVLGDRDCEACGGTGKAPGIEEHGIDPNIAVCYCGGAGWLPAAVPQLSRM